MSPGSRRTSSSPGSGRGGVVAHGLLDLTRVARSRDGRHSEERKLTMVESKRAGVPVGVRVVVLTLVIGTIAYFVWRSATRTEGYTGGDVTTTGTIDAIHVQRRYKVGGRVASVPVTERD